MPAAAVLDPASAASFAGPKGAACLDFRRLLFGALFVSSSYEGCPRPGARRVRPDDRPGLVPQAPMMTPALPGVDSCSRRRSPGSKDRVRRAGRRSKATRRRRSTFLSISAQRSSVRTWSSLSTPAAHFDKTGLCRGRDRGGRLELRRRARVAEPRQRWTVISGGAVSAVSFVDAGGRPGAASAQRACQRSGAHAGRRSAASASAPDPTPARLDEWPARRGADRRVEPARRCALWAPRLSAAARLPFGRPA